MTEPTPSIDELIQSLVDGKPDQDPEPALAELLDKVEDAGWRTVLTPLVEIELRRGILNERSLQAEREHNER